jgi:phenylpropionate dioxygenase-like ring-hydroxylating dioxygenase large terminal subunit
VRDRELFRPETLDGCQGLTPIRCETWAGTVFICLDAAAAPLSDYLDVIPAHLKAYPFERFRPFRDLWLVWDANWKTALDAFAEFYHGEDVHPEAKVMSEGYALQYDQYRNGHGRMIIANGLPSRFKDGDQVAEPVRQFLRFFGGDPDLYPDSHGRGFRAALVDTKRRWAQRNELDYFKQLTDGQVVDDWNYYFFPNMTWNVFSESLLIQRFFPHPTDPSKSIYNAITLAIPVKDPDYAIFDLNDYGPEAHKKGLRNWDGTERPPREWITDFTKLGYVLEQDARLIPDVQRGIESPNYRGHRLSESELRIRHYLAELDLYLAGRK